MGTASSAVSTQAELGSVALEIGHSHGPHIWTLHESPTEKNPSSLPLESPFFVTRAWYDRTMHVAGFFLLPTLSCHQAILKRKHKISFVTLHVKAESNCHWFLCVCVAALLMMSRRTRRSKSTPWTKTVVDQKLNAGVCLTTLRKLSRCLVNRH